MDGGDQIHLENRLEDLWMQGNIREIQDEDLDLTALTEGVEDGQTVRIEALGELVMVSPTRGVVTSPTRGVVAADREDKLYETLEKHSIKEEKGKEGIEDESHWRVSIKYRLDDGTQTPTMEFHATECTMRS